jgi:hypothetical protein
MSENMSDRMPENMSDRMSEYMSDRMSENMSDRMSEYMSDRIRHFSIHSHYCNGSTMYLSMCFCICPCLHSPCRITSPIFFRVSSTPNHDKSDPYQYSANNLFFLLIGIQIKMSPWLFFGNEKPSHL